MYFRLSHMVRLGLMGVLLLIGMIGFSPAPAEAQNSSDYCVRGQSPQFVLGFAVLADDIGSWVGDPVECEHYDLRGNAYQKTTRGLMYYDKATQETTYIPDSWIIEGTAGPIPTADELIARYSIPVLQAQRYGQEGNIEIVRRMGSTASFTRYEIAYLSDGLRIGGFMNVPFGNGRFPVVIVNHGSMPRSSYDLLTYTTKYADAIASAGFITIHPNYRNHRGSDYGPNPYSSGYVRDILNLIPMARRLPQADGNPVGLWGHSMGGGASLEALTITNEVKAAVLYASITGNEGKNSAHWMNYYGRYRDPNSARGRIMSQFPSPITDARLNQALSSIYYLNYVNAAIAIHHGVQDRQVPFDWSLELARELDRVGVPYDFYRYAYQDHNFIGSDEQLLNQRVISFFRQHLLGSAEAEDGFERATGGEIPTIVTFKFREPY